MMNKCNNLDIIQSKIQSLKISVPETNFEKSHKMFSRGNPEIKNLVGKQFPWEKNKKKMKI